MLQHVLWRGSTRNIKDAAPARLVLRTSGTAATWIHVVIIIAIAISQSVTPEEIRYVRPQVAPNELGQGGSTARQVLTKFCISYWYVGPYVGRMDGVKCCISFRLFAHWLLHGPRRVLYILSAHKKGLRDLACLCPAAKPFFACMAFTVFCASFWTGKLYYLLTLYQ